ncbi:MAG: hypothetical protein ABGZ17_10770, partial [Planctomycetaceae bacterium]
SCPRKPDIAGRCRYRQICIQPLPQAYKRVRMSSHEVKVTHAHTPTRPQEANSPTLAGAEGTRPLQTADLWP